MQTPFFVLIAPIAEGGLRGQQRNGFGMNSWAENPKSNLET